MLDLIQFIIVIVIIVSSSFIIYASLKSIARLDNINSPGIQGSLWERWTRSGISEIFDKKLNKVLHRFLRKIKIFILKTDNKLTYWLKKTRDEDNGNGNSQADFKEISEAVANGREHKLLSDMRKSKQGR